MAVTHSFVRVAPDSTGKKIDNVEIEGFERQVTATGDPETRGAIAGVRNAPPAADDYGALTRNISIGNYDSGRVVLPDAEAQLTDVDTFVAGIVLINLKGTIQKVTVKNDAGELYLDELPLAAHQVLSLPFFGARIDGGIRWFANNADSVVGQVMGSQNA